jgi:hypothetical protein
MTSLVKKWIVFYYLLSIWGKEAGDPTCTHTISGKTEQELFDNANYRFNVRTYLEDFESAVNAYVSQIETNPIMHYYTNP